jgi:plasmid maintenance system antidote protein VapI
MKEQEENTQKDIQDKKDVIKAKRNNKRVKRSKLKIQHSVLKQIMQEEGISANELAAACETNAGHMSRIVNAQRPCISLPMALKIAHVLNRPVEEIWQLTKPVRITKSNNNHKSAA